MDGNYGKKFSIKYVQDIVRYFGLKLQHGLKNSQATILSQFHEFHPKTHGENEDFCPIISKSMTYETFKQIQASVKLNDNQTGAVKKGTPGYDPSARYLFIYDVLAANTNSLTFKAADDLCADEGTWPTQCRGEAVSRIHGKSCTMGGQTTIVADVGYF